MKTSPIFIAGWDGFIGKHLARSLRAGFPTAPLDGCGSSDLDLTAENAWNVLAERLTADSRLIVLAGVKRQAGDAYDSFTTNMQIAVSVARAIEKAKPASVMFFSSAAVYGEETDNTAISEDTPVNPVSLYGIAKFASERLLQHAAKAAGSPLMIIRPPLIYGPGDTTNSYGPVGFCRAHAKSQTVTLWGDGAELREFLFIEDCCGLLGRLLAENPRSGVLNLAAGESHTFRDVLSVLEQISARGVDTLAKPRSKTKADNKFDPSLLRSIIPNFRFTSLEDGVRKTFDHESRKS